MPSVKKSTRNSGPRRLALFFDGTWNTPKSQTNVERLYNLTDSQVEFRATIWRRSRPADAAALSDARQIKYYHAGVGTHWYEALLGGITGYGLSRNIKEGYLWLAEHFRPNDAIYVFGFSRGAYTARSLVGLIRKCGILRVASKALVKEAYFIYRNKNADPKGREATAFRDTFSWKDSRVHFIGVWDTVGALGIPGKRVFFSADSYTWHDTQLSKIVKNAYHALALDEHRSNFAPTAWSIEKPPRPGQKIEQRWFSGAHADVGGGEKSGRLQELSLAWIQQKAQVCGLKFKKPVRPDADVYLDEIHDSFGRFLLGLYKYLPGVFPYYRPFGLGINESIDQTILKRVNAPQGRSETGAKYHPPEIP
ncbi:MAG TPA: DUF2235 domain-containing protein [Bacteroidota bacterium]|nr:DUF2235 domain-containing protein [Bacteroidota bacterium]